MVVTAGSGGASGEIWFGRAGIGAELAAENVLFAADVDWGGASNPLLAALPEKLRYDLSAGSTEPGLLSGLSDARLSRAIVAIHGNPGRNWRNDDLAEVAGLSLSRFAETFASVVGETPAAYLRRWRLLVARQDLQNGDRVDAVARRYGYQSAEGFARAFRQHYGQNPLAMRGSRVGHPVPEPVAS